MIDAHFGNLNLVGQNVHFVQIERFLQERVTDPQEVLDLYDRVLGGQRIREQPSVAHLELKLSGLVRRAPDGMLTLNNRIYARLFDEVWLSAELQRRARVTSIADQQLREILDVVSREKGIPVAALAEVLRAFGEDEVGADPSHISERLLEWADQYLDLLGRLGRITPDDPRVGRLLQQATEPISSGKFDVAEARLSEAEAMASAASTGEQDLAGCTRARAASIRADRAAIARLRLDYRAAAAHLAAAATMVQDTMSAWRYRFQQAEALYNQGSEFGDNRALLEAISVYREALRCMFREQMPLDWAQTQNNLGAALAALGERESGTARLEQAVAAYRAALEEFTRESVPLRWAATQTNLGTVLLRLGERESGTARLEQAVAAYLAALEERTRERTPLDWAQTQANLGTVLLRLGRAGERHGAVGAGGDRLPRHAGGEDTRTDAARLGPDAEQSRGRARGPWRAGERDSAAGAGGGRLPCRAGGVNARARASSMGSNADESRDRAP